MHSSQSILQSYSESRKVYFGYFSNSSNKVFPAIWKILQGIHRYQFSMIRKYSNIDRHGKLEANWYRNLIEWVYVITSEILRLCSNICIIGSTILVNGGYILVFKVTRWYACKCWTIMGEEPGHLKTDNDHQNCTKHCTPTMFSAGVILVYRRRLIRWRWRQQQGMMDINTR